MRWAIGLSNQADKFIKANNLDVADIFEVIKLCVNYFQGFDANIDLKKLKGKWKGFYRIRKGKLRIIADFNFEKFEVFIEIIDYWGNVYK